MNQPPWSTRGVVSRKWVGIAWRWAPLLFFVLLVGVAWIGWQWGGKPAPSVWVGRQAPPMTATAWQSAGQSAAVWRSEDMLGKVWVLHAWASWCAACRQDHDWLMWTLHRESDRPTGLSIIGLDYKDPQGALWLQRAGNPYDVVVTDPTGAMGLQWGLTALPETFVIDASGTIRHHQSGPLTQEIWQNTLLPLIHTLMHSRTGAFTQ